MSVDSVHSMKPVVTTADDGPRPALEHELRLTRPQSFLQYYIEDFFLVVNVMSIPKHSVDAALLHMQGVDTRAEMSRVKNVRRALGRTAKDVNKGVHPVAAFLALIRYYDLETVKEHFFYKMPHRATSSVNSKRMQDLLWRFSQNSRVHSTTRRAIEEYLVHSMGRPVDTMRALMSMYS